MSFNSYTFVLFFVGVMLVYHTLRSWTARKGFLLGASCVFYGAWNVWFVPLLVFSTVVDWELARRIHRSDRPSVRRGYVAASLVIGLGLLGFFKYACFLQENAMALAGWLGAPCRAQCLDIVLPVGISFYTFQTLSYTLDVYRRRMEPWPSFLDYALYVTFFPQLVAGPVVRAPDFLPQCLEPKRVCCRDVGWGLFLMALGLFEKVALADGLLAPTAEAVYDTVRVPSMAAAWVGTVAFAGQILCDFAGYSTCAIGAALCLGFRLPQNFRFPYAAVGFSDFWQRWHMSLSSWFRDYLYVSLGGNARGGIRTSINLLATMLMVGLWHGAAWTFVAWGAIHGVYLVAERGIRAVAGDFKGRVVLAIPMALGTFVCVCVAWVFFRAASLERAVTIVRAMAGRGIPEAALDVTGQAVGTVAVVMASILAVHGLMRNRSLEDVVARWPWWVQSIATAGLLVGIVVLSGEDRAFLYFQF